MAHPVIMPRQGQSVESCILTKWHKQPGDTVAVGDILFSYETDKAGFDEEAPAAGTLLAVFYQEGDDVPVLLNVCVIGQAGEDISSFAPGAAVPAGADAASAEAAPVAEPAPAAAPNPVAPASGEVIASPRAKNAAQRAGVDLAQVSPSGPHGRVIERDVTAARAAGVGLITPAAKDAGLSAPQGGGLGGRVSFAAQGSAADAASVAEIPSAPTTAPAPASAPAAAAPASASGEIAFTDTKIPNIRKVIARAMHASLADMAQLTYNTSFDATAILAYRQKLKDNMERLGLANITLNDVLLYAVARTLAMEAHRDLNANFLGGDTLRHFPDVHLGVAVDTPRGLMVPTVFYANRKSLDAISAEVKTLAAQCKSGSINPDLLKNGTFTVTNLGNLGVESFTPVINPPQTGILGVDTVIQKPRPGKNGGVEFYPAMGLSLTADHRVVDGTPAARFLQDLCKNLENFDILMAK